MVGVESFLLAQAVLGVLAECLECRSELVVLHNVLFHKARLAAYPLDIWEEACLLEVVVMTFGLN